MKVESRNSAIKVLVPFTFHLVSFCQVLVSIALPHKAEVHPPRQQFYSKEVAVRPGASPLASLGLLFLGQKTRCSHL